MARSRNQEFWNVKKEQSENMKKISEEKAAEIINKTKKRNRVRLMEIEAKENIVSSWNRKLSEMKQSRRDLINKKLKEHE